MFERSVEREPYTGLYRAIVQLRSTTYRAPRGLFEPEPNAPLLIRIVRDPYEETPRGPRRVRLYEPIRVGGRERILRPPPVAQSRDLRGEPVTGNPLRTLALHPAPLAPPPPVDAWLTSRGDAWNA